jgi:hypothetical protein
MSSFLATSIAPRLNLTLLRRDFFDGFSLLLQDADGEPYDLSGVQVCASVWKTDASGVTTKVLDINTEEQEPLSAGRVRFWLTSAQTNTLWTEVQTIQPTNVFFPNAYTDNIRSSLFWEARIEKEEQVADLVSVSGGTFVTQTNHTLASSERVVFRGTSNSSINYNNTSARIYSGLTDISYLAPYSFTITALSGVTDAAIGGSVYRLRQDTVVAGDVEVGATIANCFP